MTTPQAQAQQPSPYPYPPPMQQPVVMAPMQQPAVMAVPQPMPVAQYVPQQQPGVQFVPVPQGGMPLAPQTVSPATGNHLPSHNLILTVIVTIACAILNLTSLMIGAPALICAIMAYLALTQQRFSTTKNMGYTAIALSVVNIAYTGIVSILIVGLTIGLYCGHYRYEYYYYYYRRC